MRGGHKNFTVKCQRSLVTTEPSGVQALFYTKDRLRTWMGPMPADWKDQFGPEGSKEPKDNKFFAMVHWAGSRKPPKLIRKVPDQGW